MGTLLIDKNTRQHKYRYVKTKTESLSIRLESELMRKLESLAAAGGKTRAQYIREILEVAAQNNWQIQYQISVKP